MGGRSQGLWGRQPCANGPFQEVVSFWRVAKNTPQPRWSWDCTAVNEAWYVLGSGCCVGSGCVTVRKQKPENSSHKANVNIHSRRVIGRAAAEWALMCHEIYTEIKVRCKKQHSLTFTLWGNKMFRSAQAVWAQHNTPLCSLDLSMIIMWKSV